MQPKLEWQLYQNYPGLFAGWPTDSCGLEYGLMGCHEGWYTVIETVCYLLSARNGSIRFLQIKEKFGCLRIYFQRSDDYSKGVKQMAELISARTCEICGNPGVLYKSAGWLATRCLSHTSAENLAGYCQQPAIKSIRNMGIGWSGLVTDLTSWVEAYQKYNANCDWKLEYRKSNGRLHVNFLGGDNTLQGAIDCVNSYCSRIDECSGACTIINPGEQ